MLDYHIHTRLCGHAAGEPDEYVQFALTQPLREIGFADHLPLLKWGKPEYAMRLEQLPEYVEIVHRLQAAYPALSIKLGIEADYYPGEEDTTRELVARHPFDYVYGSVHFIDGWAFDDPREMGQWDQRNVNSVYEQYFTRLQQAAKSGVFDIIAHIDVIKKFGHRPTRDLSELIEETVRIFRDSSMAVEINTAGLRKPVGEIYPSGDILRLLQRYDIPIVLGSDSHHPQEIGKHFEIAIALLKEYGFRELVAFKQRRITTTYPL